MTTLRRRVEGWNWPVALAGRGLSAYLARCLRSSSLEVRGGEAFATLLSQGPVLIVGWHSRLFYGPPALMRFGHPFTAIRDPSPAGRIGGVIQSRFGMQTIGVKRGGSSAATLREILKAVKAGQSIALAGDGPEGPARQMKAAVIDWARATGLPVVTMANAGVPHRRASSWDRLMIPRPRGRVVNSFERWEETVPRKLDEGEGERLRLALQDALDAHQDRVDEALGIAPGA